MKSILTIASLIGSFLLVSSTVRAGNIAGGQLYYTWVTGNTYLVRLQINVDCKATIAEPDSVALCYYQTCSATGAGSVFLKKVNTIGNGNPLGEGCVTWDNQCINPNSPFQSFRQWLYVEQITLPSQCSTWVLRATPGEREATLNLKPTNKSASFVCELNNSASQNNSSPRFLSNPRFVTSASAAIEYFPTVIDPDGDSVYFRLVDSRNAETGCETSPTGFLDTSASGQQPFASWSYFQLDTARGFNNALVRSPGKYIFTIQAVEIRAGVATPVRVNQEILITALPTVVRPAASSNQLSINNLVGGVERNGHIDAYVNVPLSFCAVFNSPRANLVPDVSNLMYSFPGAIDFFQNIGTDSLEICLQVTPSLNDTGLHILTYSIHDTACNGFSSGSIYPITRIESFIIDVQKTTGVGNYPKQFVNIYPNPASNVLSVSSDQKVNTELLSIAGKVVAKSFNASDLDVSTLPSGMYYLKVLDALSGEIIRLEKVVIQH